MLREKREEGKGEKVRGGLTEGAAGKVVGECQGPDLWSQQIEGCSIPLWAFGLKTATK